MAKILLVDDDIDLVEMNRLVLAHRGHEVVAAYSAAQAAEMLPTCQFDLAVLDIMLEEMDSGIMLARQIRSTRPDVPIVALSGINTVTGLPYRFEPDGEMMPVVKFLDKPVPPDTLASEIEKILSEKKK